MQNLRSAALAFTSSALLTAELAAQGVTSAGITGFVHRTDSTAIEQATITVTNMSNGERWQVPSYSGGRYAIEYLTVGGPYAVEVRAIGYASEAVQGVYLSLGEKRRIDFLLTPMAAQLPEVAVIGADDSRINAARTGPAQTFSDTLLARLPVRARDFTQFVFLSPQATTTGTGGVTIAGQSDRLNGFQIDGATNLDLIGFAGGAGLGTPGASSGVRTLSVETLQELQVLTAPFDVRYGTFAGGLVNAVTRSGTNSWHGSASVYYENASLTGRDSSGQRADDFTTGEIALTLGGPIVRDRASFFLDFGVQRDQVPQGVPAIGPTAADSAATGISYASATRFQDILRDTYGVDAGSFAAEPLRRPSYNFFGKVTLQPALNNRLELSYNHAHGNPQDPGYREPFAVYGLSSNGAGLPATINAPRLTWTSVTPSRRLNNEMVIAYLDLRERCQPASGFSEVQVNADESMLVAGIVSFCARNFSNQGLLEFTDNLSLRRGNHSLTFGTHNELIRTERETYNFATGHWEFGNLDSLEAGLPNLYMRNLVNPQQGDVPQSNMGINQVGFYVQDEWTPTPRLTLTAGLRVDIPFFTTAPVQNPALQDAMGIDNSVTPSGNPQWAPRLGVSYGLGALGYLRGGVGIFAGRPAYHMISSVYGANGLNAPLLVCADEEVPAFTLDPDSQPDTCGSGSVTPRSEVTYFDPAFRFPSNLRVALGTDLWLPWNLVGTVDLLYVRGVRQYYVSETNLQGPTGTSAGEAGRVLYGSIDPSTGRATPSRVSTQFGSVIEVRNASGDQSYSGTFQLQKNFVNGASAGLAYTYTNARDLMSATADLAPLNLAGAILDGTLEDRRQATSLFSRPHAVTFVGAINLPVGFRFSLFYNGFSGAPYTFRVQGDPNADGVSAFGAPASNDPVYVPRDEADITLQDPGQWEALNAYINENSCLQGQRGQLLRRNSCRNPWINLMNARFAKVFPTGSGQAFELTMDVFNVLNLLDSDWGVRRQVADTRILRLVGYDAANQRGIYVFQPRDTRLTSVNASRWRLQIGGRYLF